MHASRPVKAAALLAVFVLGGLVVPGLHALHHTDQDVSCDPSMPVHLATSSAHASEDCGLCDIALHFSTPTPVTSHSTHRPVSQVLLPAVLGMQGVVAQTQYIRGPPQARVHA